MEKTFDDMSSDERVVYLVDGLQQLLLTISLEARQTLRPLGFTPEKATEFKLLQMIEGEHFKQHEAGGAMDWLEWLRYTLAAKYDIEGLYESYDEDDEEFEEDDSDELEEVEA